MEAQDIAAFTHARIGRIIGSGMGRPSPFEAIHYQFRLTKDMVKTLMKHYLKFSSYKLWRARVENCKN